MADAWDCIIVGAGPSGLSAALYMARYRRKVLVLHDGTSRALRIPTTHNAPGFAGGISGPDLIERMVAHAMEYGAEVREASVTSAAKEGDRFHLATSDGERHSSLTLILATGTALNQIPLAHDVHEAAIQAGVLRYCPICDGYEHTGARIGVIGCDEQGASEALFLRQYSERVTLIPRAFTELTAAQLDELADSGISVIPRAAQRYEPRERYMEVHVEGQAEPLVFDVIYPALGCRQRTELAKALGLRVNEAGAVDARSPYGTTIAGLYCVGDIVDGLDQISVAMGHGAVAATRAHNYLRTPG